MRFTYLTTKQYPATTADHAYTQFLAKAFADLLGKRFELIVRGIPKGIPEDVPTYALRIPPFLRSVWMFCWVPIYCLRQKDGIIFFSNDRVLLLTVCIWKRMLPKNIRIISDWHEIFGSKLDAFVAKGSDLCVCTSKQLAEALIRETGISPDKVEVIYGGIELTPFLKQPPARTALGLPEEKRLVGYVGYFKTHGQEKGIRTLIDAIQFLPEETDVVLVGARNSEAEEYRSYARMKGVENRCHIFAAQSFENVAAYEKSMDVLVIPYPDQPHFREYGFPMKTYEYLAAGKPIVYSNLPIIAEVLEGIATSFIPGDPKDLARAIDTASKKKLEYENVSQFGWEAKAKRIYESFSAIQKNGAQ